eukprot:1104328-Prorocentrum_lima.AAC.1
MRGRERVGAHPEPGPVDEEGLGPVVPAATDDGEVIHRNRRTFRDRIQQIGSPAGTLEPTEIEGRTMKIRGLNM